MTLLLSDLDCTDVIEPFGWFRWLYLHYIQRNSLPNDRLIREFKSICLPKLISNFPVFLVTNPDQVLLVVARHAWALGTMRAKNVAERCWEKLSPKSRGTFLAGLSENAQSGDQAWISGHLNLASFAPESACQLACNAIRYSNATTLSFVLQSKVNWLASVSRGFWDDYAEIEWYPIVKQLSDRLIDLILEAALLCDKPEAARDALKLGADPNIPIWQLGRSFNEKHCALSYALGEQKSELARILLEAGANLNSTLFGPISSPSRAYQVMELTKDEVKAALDSERELSDGIR